MLGAFRVLSHIIQPSTDRQEDNAIIILTKLASTNYTRPPKRHAMPKAPIPHSLINTNPLCSKLRPCCFNLSHQFLVGLWNVIECEDAVSEFEEEVCAEGNEAPEG